MIFRESHFPTSIYISDFKDENLNKDLEENILAWANKDKGITRTNVKGWHSTSNMQDKIEYKNGAQYSFEEMVELEIEQFNTLAAHGKAAHIYLQWVAEENPSKKMTLRQEFDNLMLATEGRRQLNQ